VVRKTDRAQSRQGKSSEGDWAEGGYNLNQLLASHPIERSASIAKFDCGKGRIDERFMN
jgi:hypothetical protein